MMFKLLIRRGTNVIFPKPIYFGYCAVLVIVVFFISSGSNISRARAQVLPTPESANQHSPHWPHISILDFGRQIRAIPNLALRTQAFEWFTQHVDVMETSMDNSTLQGSDMLSSYLHTLNPTLQTFGYDYDLTMCQREHCDQLSGGPHTIFSNLPEEYYLHFSEDTQLEFRDLNNIVIKTVSVSGCPEPNAITSTCRVQAFLWTQERWLSNVQDTAWRTSTADRFIQELQTNSSGQANSIDGLFLDEHGASFPAFGGQTTVLSGGGIREYGGLRPETVIFPNHNELDQSYAGDVASWLSYLQGRLATVGKFAHINTAEYFADQLALSAAVAMKGVMTEHLNRPDSNGIIRATRYQEMINAVRTVVLSGGRVDLSGSWCNNGPIGYTPGNYENSKDRYRMWSLASYYLVKEMPGDSGKVFFDPNLCIDPSGQNPLSFIDEWLPAYQVNVGEPTELATVATSGTIACDGLGYQIFSRKYTGSQVFVRVKDGFACNAYDDTTIVEVPLSESMVMLMPDGSFSSPMTTVSLRNAEAVIMFPAPDVISPAAVITLVAEP